MALDHVTLPVGLRRHDLVLRPGIEPGTSSASRKRATAVLPEQFLNYTRFGTESQPKNGAPGRIRTRILQLRC